MPLPRRATGSGLYLSARRVHLIPKGQAHDGLFVPAFAILPGAVFGSHGNAGYGWKRTLCASGKTSDTKPHRFPLNLPAWTRQVQGVMLGAGYSAYGTAVAYTRAIGKA